MSTTSQLNPEYDDISNRECAYGHLEDSCNVWDDKHPHKLSLNHVVTACAYALLDIADAIRETGAHPINVNLGGVRKPSEDQS